MKLQRAQINKAVAEKAQEAADRYEGTVNALLCFRAIWCFDSKGKRLDTNCEIGRRMTIEKGEETSLAHSLTPDLVLQEATGFGIALEMKSSLPKEPARWREDFEQLVRYSSISSGWWYPMSASSEDSGKGHTTVALLEVSRSREFAEHLESYLANSGINLNDARIVVVEFSRADEKRQWYFFRVEGGRIEHPFGPALRSKGIKVPLNEIRQQTPAIRFCDHKPPLDYLLQIIWKDYVTPRGAGPLRKSAGDTIAVQVTVSEVTAELQKAHGSKLIHTSPDGRTQVFPRTAWIRSALDALCSIKYARKDDEETYSVDFRAITGDVLGHFATLLQESKGVLEPDTIGDQYEIPLAIGESSEPTD